MRLKVGSFGSWPKALFIYGSSVLSYAGTYWAATDFSLTGVNGMEITTLGDTLIRKHMETMPEKELQEYEKNMD